MSNAQQSLTEEQGNSPAPQFVAPTPKWLRGKTLAYCRLYAYPIEPEPPVAGEFVILDSGAYGLSRSGRKMSHAYMRELAAHYEKWGASDKFPVVGIAPDEFLNPWQSMRNFEWWMKEIGTAVAPVIQFRRNKQLDFAEVIEQSVFYASYRPEFVAISNPSLRAISAEGMEFICSVVREGTGAKWLHNLGAGWDALDVRQWWARGFDSVDSIAYYTDAQASKLWADNGRIDSVDNQSEVDIALRNLAVANSHSDSWSL